MLGCGDSISGRQHQGDLQPCSKGENAGVAERPLEVGMSYRVGVDIGGSFTDFALFDEETQSLKTLKVFSRPDEPGAEVLEGVRLVSERYGIMPTDITYFTHGTTVGINTVIQRKGLRLALFTTEHFRD